MKMWRKGLLLTSLSNISHQKCKMARYLGKKNINGQKIYIYISDFMIIDIKEYKLLLFNNILLIIILFNYIDSNIQLIMNIILTILLKKIPIDKVKEESNTNISLLRSKNKKIKAKIKWKRRLCSLENFKGNKVISYHVYFPGNLCLIWPENPLSCFNNEKLREKENHHQFQRWKPWFSAFLRYAEKVTLVPTETSLGFWWW